MVINYWYRGHGFESRVRNCFQKRENDDKTLHHERKGKLEREKTVPSMPIYGDFLHFALDFLHTNLIAFIVLVVESTGYAHEFMPIKPDLKIAIYLTWSGFSAVLFYVKFLYSRDEQYNNVPIAEKKLRNVEMLLMVLFIIDHLIKIFHLGIKNKDLNFPFPFSVILSIYILLDARHEEPVLLPVLHTITVSPSDHGGMEERGRFNESENSLRAEIDDLKAALEESKKALGDHGRMDRLKAQLREEQATIKDLKAALEEALEESEAKELGTKFLSKDGLFGMIRASAPKKAPVQCESKETDDKAVASVPKTSPKKIEMKKDPVGNSSTKTVAPKALASRPSPAKVNAKRMAGGLTWTEKYKPKTPNEIIGNQSVVKQLHDWLANWNDNFLNTDKKCKGENQNETATKKAILLSGTPGIGKTTSAKLVSQMLGFQTIEVNASDSPANSVKELVSNEGLNVKMDWSKHSKSVLIMDEVDGMSAGDRGGVADLIASIKISKVPIVCICNDRYSQKLKSLVNYCLLLNFRKPTKQQMAKKLLRVAISEGLRVNKIALEELAESVNGDMRMALNQLQYIILNYDEDISPFTAVDKLLGFNGGKLKMDERIDFSMSDIDLVPLLIQENYINYRPSLASWDDNGIKRMNVIARAAESIGDGDIVIVQIRRYQKWQQLSRYQKWQLSQTSCLSSCIVPAALMHGQREVLEQGERNFNRFGGWLGKNSTREKNMRLLEDLHYHILASSATNIGRDTLRLDYLTALPKRMTDPLRQLPKDEAVQQTIEFMNEYSISLEDFDTIMELLKFKGHPNPMEGVESSVKAALTRGYKKSSSRIRAADLITLPGMKKAPKKWIAAMLEPVDDSLAEGNGNTLADGKEEEEEEESSDTEDGPANAVKKLQSNLQDLNSKGIKPGGTKVACLVDHFEGLMPRSTTASDLDPYMDGENMKGTGSSSAKKTLTGRGKGSSGAAEKKGGQG